MTKVVDIQVCGSHISHNLEDMCKEYLECLKSEFYPPLKLNFAIILSNGETKHITIRQEDEGMVAYGDFEGLSNFLEWAKGRNKL